MIHITIHIHIVGVTHHATTASAVAHHAIPHALVVVSSHSPFEVFDFVHATKLSAIAATSAVDVAAVFPIDGILHRSSVLGDVDTPLVVPTLGVLSGAVLEVSCAVVKLLTTAVHVFGRTAAASIVVATIVGALGVFAAGHEGTEAGDLGGRKRWNGHKCLRSGEHQGRRKEDGGLCEFHDE